MVQSLTRENPFKPLLILIFLVVSNFSFTQQVSSDLQAINDQIEAIRSKIEKVKADPTEHQIALDEGWYEDMNANLKKLFDKKRVIIKEQTGKTFVSIEEFDAFPPEKQEKLLQSDRHIIEQK